MPKCDSRGRIACLRITFMIGYDHLRIHSYFFNFVPSRYSSMFIS